jgi:hypothetical protein
MSRDSLRFLLSKFSHDQGDDEQVPHLFANKRVMRDLRTYLSARREDLMDVDPDRLRDAAVKVLAQDTLIREEYAASLAGASPAKPGK